MKLTTSQRAPYKRQTKTGWLVCEHGMNPQRFATEAEAEAELRHLESECQRRVAPDSDRRIRVY